VREGTREGRGKIAEELKSSGVKKFSSLEGKEFKSLRVEQ
jgi:hypothetical protein